MEQQQFEAIVQEASAHAARTICDLLGHAPAYMAELTQLRAENAELKDKLTRLVLALKPDAGAIQGEAS